MFKRTNWLINHVKVILILLLKNIYHQKIDFLTIEVLLSMLTTSSQVAEQIKVVVLPEASKLNYSAVNEN